MDVTALTVQGGVESECFIVVIQILPIRQVVEWADKIAICSPSEDHLPLNTLPALLWTEEELESETHWLFPLCVI